MMAQNFKRLILQVSFDFLDRRLIVVVRVAVINAHVHLITTCFWFEDIGCHKERRAPLHTLAMTSFDAYRPWLISS